MKTIIISLSILLTFFGAQCQNNSNNIVKTAVNKGNVSDMDLYPAAPFFQDAAGYNGKELENLPANRIVSFTKDDNGQDSKRLNAIINKLHKNGGGKITIKSGKYHFRNVVNKTIRQS